MLLFAALTSSEATLLQFTTTGVYGSYVPTGLSSAMTGTSFSLTWDQESNPVPNAFIANNETFIGDVTGTYQDNSTVGSYPTSDFYPRYYVSSMGGGYLFDGYLDGVTGGSELFVFFGSSQLFTGTVSAPQFATGTSTGDSNSNIIYGTDLNNRYVINNASLTVTAVQAPEPRTLSLLGLVPVLLVFRLLHRVTCLSRMHVEL
jgi:hypothetical protein